MKNVNDSFSEVMLMLINMHDKKVETMITSGEMTYDSAKYAIENFSSLVITDKVQFMSMYPHHDFSNLNGLSNVRQKLDDSKEKVNKFAQPEYARMMK